MHESGAPSDPSRRVLAHIRGRTITGRFATRLWNMSEREWDAALSELRAAGYDIRWTLGTVADEPTVTGGYVLAGEDATTKDARERLDEKPRRANGDGAAIVPRSPDRVPNPNTYSVLLFSLIW